MPIYSYHCPQCDSTTDVLMKYTERDNVIICPKCGKARMDRVLSGSTTFVLKGDGWYKPSQGEINE